MKATKLLILSGLGCVGATLASRAMADDMESASSLPHLKLDEARIYWEYNDSDNDLGVHVFVDGEEWKRMEISDPNDFPLFGVAGFGPYKVLGMTELFYEGAEPSLDDVSLAKMLTAFPEGEYDFEGRTIDGVGIEGESMFSHAIPDGPDITATVGPNNFLEISWTAVTAPPPGFPVRPIQIAGYQVIIESFQVTVPASVLSVTVPPEFVGSLGSGQHEYEVLAIERNHNQTITQGVFTL